MNKIRVKGSRADSKLELYGLKSKLGNHVLKKIPIRFTIEIDLDTIEERDKE